MAYVCLKFITMEIKGMVSSIGVTVNVSDRFSKRDLVLKTEYLTEYPQHLLIQFVNKKTSELDSIGVGDVVTVSINLKGRQWVDKDGEVRYFNTIEGWKIKLE